MPTAFNASMQNVTTLVEPPALPGSIEPWQYTRRARCAGCRLPPALCLCDWLPRVSVPVRFVVVQHTDERVRLSSSGWAIPRLLPGSKLIVHGAPVRHAGESEAWRLQLDPDRTFVMLPSVGARPLGPELGDAASSCAEPSGSQASDAWSVDSPENDSCSNGAGPNDAAATRLEPASPLTLVVPDGTWQQARRMVQRLPALRTLPRCCLPALAPTNHLLAIHPLRPPAPGHYSTLAAVVRAVECLGYPAEATLLARAHAEITRRVLHLRGRTTLRELATAVASKQ